MKTRLFTFVLVLLAACPASSADEDIIRPVDDIVSAYADVGWFSGTVALHRKGSVFYQSSHGLADQDNDIANALDTRIRIGSINKHYTQALVLRLVQQGRLGLDDTLARFELGFPDAVAQRITVRHLLSHRSGFEDLFTDEYRRTYQSLKTIEDKLPLLMDAPLRFEPGTDQHYSNYGYIVLGAIVEQVTGRSFAEALEVEILRPIGVSDTYYALTDQVPGKALSYAYTHTGRKFDVTDRLENVTPDGGMYATAADLVTFYDALFYTNKLIADPMKTLLFSRFQETDRTWADVLTDPDAIRVAYGGGPGVSAAVELLLRDRLFVVVLANTDALVAERMSQRITQVLQGGEPDPMRLPVAVFTYKYLESVGKEVFLRELPAVLSQGGYDDFSDRWLNRLGFELFERGEAERAVTVLTANSRLFPEEPNTYDSLGYVYEQLGNHEQAISFYQKTLALDPSFTSAVEGLERLGHLDATTPLQ